MSNAVLIGFKTDGSLCRVRNRLGTDITVDEPLTSGEVALIKGTLAQNVATVNVKDFGASTALADNKTQFDAAIAAVASVGAGIVQVPEGAFKINGQLVLPAGVYLYGRGSGASTLDFRSSTATVAHILGSGGLTALPALSVAIAAGDTTVTFASAPTVAPGDVFIVHDETPSSFSTARDYYQQGEHFRVHSVAGNVVTIVGSARNSYALGASRKLYRVAEINVGISGFRMYFKEGGAPGPAGIKLSMASGAQLVDLHLSGSNYGQIFLDRCGAINLSGVRGFDFQVSVGNNYGLVGANCWEISLSGCNFHATREGLDFGGGGLGVAGIIPNRLITVSGSTFGGGSGAVASGMNLHGNCEDVRFVNCSFPNGAGYGGDRISFASCTFENAFANGTCATSAELVGSDIAFTSCTFIARRDFSLGLVNHTITSVTTRPGTLTFSGANKFLFGGFMHPTTRTDIAGAITPTQITAGIRVTTAADSGTTQASVNLEGGEFRTDTTAYNPFYALFVMPNAAKHLERVSVSGTPWLKGCGIQIGNNVKYVSIGKVRVIESCDRGIYFSHITAGSAGGGYFEIDGSLVHRSLHCGIDSRLTAADEVRIFDTRSTNNARKTGGTGAAVTDTSLYCLSAGKAEIRDNDFGDTSGAPTQQQTYAVQSVALLEGGENRNVGRYANNLPFSHTTITDNQMKGVTTGGTAAPTTGRWERGDLVRHSAPSASGTEGWVCTAAGTPGTWKARGTIAA
jgi:hypothetical protein